MDVPLFWKELTRVVDLGRRWSGCGWRRLEVSLCLSGKRRGKIYLGRVLFVECPGTCRSCKAKTICAANVHGGKACP
eukprot:370653-Pelagomonas_calceolata.AAC.1